ncbi:tRNA preQ1(34) S-adenosylmethionine ribosyltransferase-isomerase QueA [Patescibacteria group bacterium]|nr:tRNA preQ1(34) S-adenosylmethionine ribosyltransferase-isomerase QueA [Candidatus Falkowbacteria bacterium]MBU3906112.1 tRNA preQ1(34) S-adenosylmethionine ribosyltransferase-isomerase QueA [Patescibacteria group bacterium]MBU4014697.1 tRNA preQ1(34) S-adenosylmethionine ribosyltransferase-isomerase QueA [Patescibacteria group bacterium]MBU4025978.1 tRNA preQ1(34) S-adenosylmethionine ribosyltransferase-isomerase QueA [Patescibacteria group bacterium]MBU4073160.1 tRNA preQ1(34) S-adenosylmet
MRLKDFDYNLPKNLIAQTPVKPRDHSRLLVLRKAVQKSAPSAGAALGADFCIQHKHFYDIVDYFKKGDVLVLNNSKVFPARLIGKKKETGGRIEVFLLSPTPNPSPASRERGAIEKKFQRIPSPETKSRVRVRDGAWQCLLGGNGRKENLEIKFKNGLECKILKNNNDGTWEVEFNKSGKQMMEIVEKIGKMPLPPYIKRDDRRQTTDDRNNYQTVYADDKKIGSVAAPTAGFHFTPELIKKLKNKGARFEYVTLHVGMGTFAPVKVDDIAKHKMHAELVEVRKDVLKRIVKAKKEKRRIIAVGTTSVRTLEGLISGQLNKPLNQISNFKLPITTFIYPGYKFKVVDAMITNFHLPKSTLLMLVSALAGKSNIDKAYKEAIKNKYRFYSYGDAMLIY